MTKKIRNFVHKASIEINKPKVFRDRKKEYKRKEKFENYEHETPEHRPYSRNGKQNKNTRFEDEYEEEQLENQEEADE